MTTTDNTSASTETPLATGVWPAFKARDARALIDWLVSVLGFVENVAYVDDGRISHAQLDWPAGGGVMLGDLNPDGGWDRLPGVSGTYLVSDDVDAIYRQAKAAGATITRELADQDYGTQS